ncbi:MAG: diaminopropionate ammonia-lyase [Micrococcaceae bacterium]
MEDIVGVDNKFNTPDAKPDKRFNKKKMEEVRHFHKSLPFYEPTPLESLDNLADHLGLKKLYVKNEGKRFGLNAFKGLGVCYAVAKHYADALGLDMRNTTFTELKEKAEKLAPITFTTATDGNHGKSLAWSAKLFGQQARVYMPKVSRKARLDAILAMGAKAKITDMNYDDTVEMVAKKAEENGWVLVQDTSFGEYFGVPTHIMQGYTSIVTEIQEQLGDTDLTDITHVFLQAGVGSFPAAIAATIHNIIGDNHPTFAILEPNRADCFYQSAKEGNGETKRVHGDLDTMMAGLACGEPNPIAWEILNPITDSYYSCEEDVSGTGMRVLGNPIDSDTRIISGESGALPLGFVYELMRDDKYEGYRKKLKLDENSQVLVINTEGDTDPINYRKVVWDNN